MQEDKQEALDKVHGHRAEEKAAPSAANAKD
jgi:hypothetical protein